MDLVYERIRTLASMDESSRKNLKRWFAEDEKDSNEQPPEKQQRFPEENMSVLFGRPRKVRRNMPKIFADDDDDEEDAEESHENDAQEGIDIDIFSLESEKEEGYFDANGDEPFNLDEENEEWYFDADGYCVREKEELGDNIEEEPMFLGGSALEDDEDGGNEMELCQEVLRRRIADVLEPGETVLQALRRLKGNNCKEKMTDETKRVFDQLTEDADKLYENGDFNVYLKEQEVFEKDAERLAQREIEIPLENILLYF